MKERIISSRVRKSEWDGTAMWEIMVSSATFTDAHYGHFYEEREHAAAQRVAESAVGKIATFEGSRDTVAYID